MIPILLRVHFNVRKKRYCVHENTKISCSGDRIKLAEYRMFRHPKILVTKRLNVCNTGSSCCTSIALQKKKKLINKKTFIKDIIVFVCERELLKMVIV